MNLFKRKNEVKDKAVCSVDGCGIELMSTNTSGICAHHSIKKKEKRNRGVGIFLTSSLSIGALGLKQKHNIKKVGVIAVNTLKKFL